jgi:hypothetical protein
MPIEPPGYTREVDVVRRYAGVAEARNDQVQGIVQF